MRRPQDGSNDVRSTTRRERPSGRATQPALTQATSTMTVRELIALAHAQGIDTGAKPTKAKLLALLAGSHAGK